MASDLGLYCVPMIQRKALGLYGFTVGFFTYFFLIFEYISFYFVVL